MDPIASSVIASLITNSISSAARILGKPLHPELETRVQILETSLNLDVEDTAKLESALKLPSTEILVSILVETALNAGTDSTEFAEIAEKTASDFAEIAKSDDRFPYIEFSLIRELWMALTSVLTDPYRDLDFKAQDKWSSVSASENKISLEIHSKERRKLALDHQRLGNLLEISQQINSAAHQNFRDLRISHAMEEHRRAFNDLYVSRNLQFDDGPVRTTDEINVHRFVITGPPGVGKSTFVTQILRMTEGTSGHASTPMLLRARETQPDETLTSGLARSMRSLTQQDSLDTHTINDLLVLGLGLVVFDGIDEIRSLPQRRKFVADIETFAAKYPTTKIVVTSREVGYDSSPLSKQNFRRAVLAPFTSLQVHDYAERWFTPMNKPGLLEGFERDAETLDEIKSNPLMLSLLCTLYTARGYLPTNRRLVYEQCTQLLFHRWDSMRQIEQPSDLRNYGPDLMQDLAHMYYRSPNAQGGLQERVLQGVVEDFFKDSAGVLPADARARARDFLDFCADRAWLLGVAGVDDSGERVFTFTHQTFLEFFASEALARTRTVEQLADDIVEAYERNSSSLIPELIIQSSESARRRSGVEILKNVKMREHLIAKRGDGRFLALRIRLVAASKPGPLRLDEVFGEALDRLASTAGSGSSIDAFRALLLVSEDQRNRLKDLLRGSQLAMGEGEEGRTLEPWRTGFLCYWSALTISDDTLSYEHDWHDFVGEMRFETSINTDSPWPLRQYAFRNGASTESLSEADLSFHVDFGRMRIPGFSIGILQMAIEGELQEDQVPILASMSARLWNAGIDYSEAYTVFSHALSAQDDRHTDSPIMPNIQKLLAPFVCMCLEIAEDHQVDSLLALTGPDEDKIRAAIARRDEAARGSRSSEGRGRANWLTKWSRAELSFVRVGGE